MSCTTIVKVFSYFLIMVVLYEQGNASRLCGKALPEALDAICVNGFNKMLKRSSYFWHITDLHLDTIYSTQGDIMRSCWRIERQSPSTSTRSPGRFGDYLCDSPWSLIESAARAMKSRQGDNVEFVLWTGDGLSHSSHPMFETKKLEILRNITDLLGRTFSSQFVFPVLGHEDGTTNFRHMGELWRHWLPSEALQTFEKGGYYSIEQTKSRLRIIALNTNFMRHDPKYSQSHLAAVRQRTPPNALMSGTNNGAIGTSESQDYKNYYYHHGSLHQHHGHGGDWNGHSGYGYNSHHRGVSAIPGGASDGSGARVSALSEFENQDTEKQWIWLADVLSKSKDNKETVYIIGHIPPGSDERHIGLQQNGHTTFTESNNKRYLELVRKYSSIIQGQFFGHLHSDSFRIIYDEKGKPVSWMMISPSVTPRKMSVGSNNPAMRLYKFDTDSGQVLDYTQYYMDLQLANTLGEPNWVPEYNLTHYYALSDISAISLHNFVDRFTSNDGSWFTKYYRANTVRYQADPCEGVCMLNHYCAITRIDYKEFRQCLEKEQSALRSHTKPILGAACPLLVLVCALAASCRTFAKILPKIIRGKHCIQSQATNHFVSTTIKVLIMFIFALLLRWLHLIGRLLRHLDCQKNHRCSNTESTTNNNTTTATTSTHYAGTPTENYMQQRSTRIVLQAKGDFIVVAIVTSSSYDMDKGIQLAPAYYGVSYHRQTEKFTTWPLNEITMAKDHQYIAECILATTFRSCYRHRLLVECDRSVCTFLHQILFCFPYIVVVIVVVAEHLAHFSTIPQKLQATTIIGTKASKCIRH